MIFRFRLRGRLGLGVAAIWLGLRFFWTTTGRAGNQQGVANQAQAQQENASFAIPHDPGSVSVQFSASRPKFDSKPTIRIVKKKIRAQKSLEFSDAYGTSWFHTWANAAQRDRVLGFGHRREKSPMSRAPNTIVTMNG